MKKIYLIVGALILAVGIYGAGTLILKPTPPANVQNIRQKTLETKPMLKPKTAPVIPKPVRLGKPQLNIGEPEKMILSTATENLLIENALTQNLGRKAIYKSFMIRQSGPWKLVCGAPKELDGQTFNYKNSALKKYHALNMIDDRFCVLLKKHEQGYQLVELDLGSTDSPILKWKERYKLPSDFF